MLFFNYEEKKAKDHYSKIERSTTGLETNHWLNEYTVRGGGGGMHHFTELLYQASQCFMCMNSVPRK